MPSSHIQSSRVNDPSSANVAAIERYPARSWFDYFATQLRAVADRLRLPDLTLQTFEIICRESLAIPCSAPLGFSRINFDGTPLQYSLALGAFDPRFQFISETRVPGSANLDHLKLSKQRIETLLQLLAIDRQMFPLAKVLDEMVPENDPDLLSDHAGALWLSPGFSPRGDPQLTVYMNAKWGPANNRRDRLHRFASYFAAEVHWQKFEALANNEMEPLGAAITLSENSPPSGRIYLSTFGRRVEYFANLSRALTQCSFDELFQRYASITLGDASKYPTQSAVCSIGVGSAGDPDLKIELCGHCAFASDVQAKSKCLEWLEYVNVDPTPYSQLLAILAEGDLSPTSSVLHAYVGVGIKRSQPYSTIYLKPNAIQTA